jgi:nitrile hydratase subunit beta
MDGVHDLGGREGFGPIPFKDDDQPFHGEWEKRVYGMAQASGGDAGWSIDWFRFCRELMPPADYLARSYFDHWLSTLAAQMVDGGYITLGELKTGGSAFKPVPGNAPPTAREAREYVRNPRSYAMAEDRPSRFSAGDRVRALKFGHSGHTRLPAYARGRAGIVLAHHRFHILPDASARGEHRGAHLYTVRFAAAELWPEAQGRTDQVFVDLWEDYLEPA